MRHNQACELARPDTPCKCKCGGAFHGRIHQDKLNRWLNMEKNMTVEMGGEVGEEVQRILKKGKVRCYGICFKETDAQDIRGYPHDGGLADKDGKKWWVYVHCSNPVEREGKLEECGYDTSWGKIRD